MPDCRHSYRNRSGSVVAVSLSRRRACGWLLLPATQLLVPSLAWANAARVASARMWPAQEYTRVIIEAAMPVAHELLTLKDPHRIVLDLEGVELTPPLAELPLRLQPTDPYIAGIRFGKVVPGVLRIVFDLKIETRPQLFALKPVADYGHRVVLDLYPTTPLDPLMALLEEPRRPVASPTDVPAGAPAGAPDRLPEPKPKRRECRSARSPWHSIPGTVARTRAQSGGAVPTRSMWRWRSRRS